MQQVDYLTKLLGFQGFFITGITIERKGDVEVVIIDLDREEATYTCSGCGGSVTSRHSCYVQEIRHLHLWQYVTILRFERVKVRCRGCGIRIEAVDFIERYARVTRYLSHQVGQLCKVMTVEDIATFQHLHWQSVKDIDKRSIERAREEQNLSGITVLGVDEISVGRGHRYWHIVSGFDGPNGPEVIYVGEGRKEEDLELFWQWFGKERTGRITHAVMDMWKGFISSFRKHCPGIRIIYNKFHLMRHLLEALNEVRETELKKADKSMRGALCGKKFILLKKMSRVKGEARIRPTCAAGRSN